MTDDPIIVRIHRGVGNQLFQYAAARSLARRLGAPVRCDNPGGGQHLRACIGSGWQAPTTRELWRCGTARHGSVLPHASRLRRAAASVGERLGRPPRRFAPDDARTYDPAWERLTAPCYLFGYFQDERYWADVVDDVTAQVGRHLGLEPDDATGDRATLGIHLRRGDYVHHGWVLGSDYYRDAVEMVLAQLDEPSIRVIGDDLDAVGDLAAELAAAGHRVEPDDGRARHEDASLSDLVRLAECDHLIVSNSSFAWWGAALGDHLHAGRSRIVAMPDVWIRGDRSTELRRPGWRPVAATTVDDSRVTRP